MALELLLNGAMALFFGYSIFNAFATQPAGKAGELSGRTWSVTILALLVLFLIINMINIWRNTPKDQRNLDSLKSISLKKIFSSGLTWGSLLILAYALLLQHTGFLLTSFVFCIAASYLLGERKPLTMVLLSLVTVTVLYLLFYKGIGVILPRGAGFLRDFALAIESLLR
jgi:Na+/melibiose symporter-like transporter